VPPTPPKSDAASGMTAQASATKQQTQSAVDLVDQLEGFVSGLKRELRAYGDADTVGRDAQQLTSYFENIHSCELQIAQFMGIPWTWQTPAGESAGR
jgi:hypothetical protein